MADKKLILIVDDSEINRIVLQKIFSYKYIPVCACNGVEALDIMRSEADISIVILDLKMPIMDGFEVLKEMQSDSGISHIPAVVVTASNERETQIKALECGALDVLTKPFDPQIILHRVKNIISRRDADILSERNAVIEEQLRLSRLDRKTGIYNKDTFCEIAGRLVKANPDTKYVIAYFDIDRFNVFNDAYGTAEGDRLLAAIGRFFIDNASDFLVYAHYDADRFVFCTEKDKLAPQSVLDKINSLLMEKYPNYEFIPRLGLYITDGYTSDAAIMCYYASLALNTIKTNFIVRYAYYDESMRDSLFEEQVIVNQMNSALEKEQFAVWLQPQYNYASGKMIGAEALVRWIHPDRGIISPGLFIPIFEKNSFITKLDEYVWRHACAMQRKWIDMGLNIVPLSVNVSRCDIYNPHLCSIITSIVEENRLTPSMIHLEITESSYMENPEQLIRIVDTLRGKGFHVEMDDFGSGYSSLNTLKSVPVDLLKMDMKFLEDDNDQNIKTSKSGNILSSVVRMAHWIKLPVLAEGVETKWQADYLKSIGCFYMQGYYFAKPMDGEKFEELLRSNSKTTCAVKGAVGADVKNAADFFDVSAQSTLLFNSFVGGAYILEYTNDSRLEILRVNDKFYSELGITCDDYEDSTMYITERFDEKNLRLYLDMLHSAIRTGDETDCEVCSMALDENSEPIWTHHRARCLSNKENSCIFYISVENISKQKELLRHNAALNSQLTAVMGNVPGGITNFIITDSNITRTYFNDMAANMFGYSREEYDRLFSANILSVIHPDDAPMVDKTLKSIRENGISSCRFKFRHIRKDGTWCWTEFFGKIVSRSEKEILASSIQLDIDRSVKNEQLNEKQAHELELRQQELNLIYAAVPCEIIRISHSDDKNTPSDSSATVGIAKSHGMLDMLGYSEKMKYLAAVQNDNLLDRCQANISRNILELYTGFREERLCENNTPYENAVRAFASSAASEIMKKDVYEKISAQNLINSFKAGKRVISVEFQRNIPKLNHAIWTDMELELYSDAENGDIKAFIYSFDINEKKTSELILNGIADKICEYIGILSPKSRTLFSYRTSEFISGESYTDTIHHIISEFVINEFRSEAKKAFDIDYILSRLENEKVYSISFVLSTANGFRRKKWEMSYIDDSRSNIVIIRSDITDIFIEQEKQRLKLENALLQAETASSAKSTFLANVSHDMRTPLNGVICCTQLAMESTDHEEILSYLTKIKASGQILLSLINDTLDLSKFETGKFTLRPEPVSCDVLVSSVISSAKTAAAEKNITINLDNSKAVMATIRTDILRTQEIFLNLLSNAIKFTPSGGSIDLIIECVKLDADCVHDRITIRDHGIGISPEFLPKIFEPFSQENRADYFGPAGTGLGLSIVKQLVEMMGGRIEVKSQIGVGTEFIVYIDFERVTADAKVGCSNADDEFSFKGMRALICEDNTINTEIAAAVLRKFGVTSDCARDGIAGLEMFRCSELNRYDFIIMDIRMPNMNGYEAAREIRALDRGDAKTIPIVAISANAYEDDISQSLEAGMNAHIAKPVDIVKLRSTLIQLLKKK